MGTKFQSVLKTAREGPRYTPGPADPCTPCWSTLHLLWWPLRVSWSCSGVFCACLPLKPGASFLLESWLGTTSPLPVLWTPEVGCDLSEVTPSSKPSQICQLMYPSGGSTGKLQILATMEAQLPRERVKLRPPCQTGPLNWYIEGRLFPPNV